MVSLFFFQFTQSWKRRVYWWKLSVNVDPSLLIKISSQKYINCAFKYNVFQKLDIWAFNKINWKIRIRKCQLINFFSHYWYVQQDDDTIKGDSKTQMMGNHVETISLCLVIN